MSEITGTPITELSGDGGLTHHQTRPLTDHGVTTIERLAELVDEHREKPEGSALSEVPRLGGARIDRVCAAIDRWRTAAQPVAG